MRWEGVFPRFLYACAVVVFGTTATASHAQSRPSGVYSGTVAIPDYDAETTVYREHVEVVLPPTYLLVRRPDPPLRGFYVWKFSFAGNPGISLVFRADSALSASDDRAVVRASALYECRNDQQWALDCTSRVRATARAGAGAIVIDITEPGVVARIRAARATVLQRQLFEPGGRFRVDETGVKYR